MSACKECFAVKCISIIFIVIVLILLSSCSIDKPVVEKINSVKIIGFESDTMHLQASVDVFNPNFISLNINEINANLAIGNNVFGSMTMPLKTELESKKSTSLEIDMFVCLPNLMSDFQNIIEQDSVAITIQGKYDGSKWFFEKTVIDTNVIYVDFKKELSSFMDDKSQEMIGLVSIRKVDLSIGKSIFEIELQVDNPFPFPIKIDSLAISMYPQGVNNKIADVESIGPMVVCPKCKSKLLLKTKLSHVDVVVSIGQVLLNRKLGYDLRGSVFVEAFSVSIKLPISFTKSML
jgi:LEA14-like dessication related protein